MPGVHPRRRHAAPVVVLGIVLIGLLLGTAIGVVGSHERRIRTELGGDASVIRTVRALVFGRIAIVAVAHVAVAASVLLHAQYGGAAEIR